jgi:TPR repeat protein
MVPPRAGTWRLATWTAVLLWCFGSAATAHAGDSTESTEQLRGKAAAGDVPAQSELAQRYILDRGPAEEQAQLAAWLEQSSAAGDPLAQVELANLYALGIGVERDPSRALALFRQAAEQHFPRAYGGLGVFYHHGIPDVLEPDHAQAAAWYRKAIADGDHGLSMLRLGYLHRDGQGVEQDVGAAVKLLEQAAGRGIGEAYAALGTLYESGWLDLAGDEQEAAVWYQGAIDRGYDGASLALGNMYTDGRGVPRDDRKAAELYQRAIDAGVIGGYINLAWMCQNGRGVERDRNKAFRLNLTAARAGHAVGQYNVGLDYQHGLGVPRDIEKAYEWFDAAARQGDTDALRKRDEIRKGWDLTIRSVRLEPARAKRGEPLQITVEYTAALPDLPVPVREQWTLLLDGEPVVRPFERAFRVRVGRSIHTFAIPVPTQAPPGRYTLRLHAASPTAYAAGEHFFEIP